MRIRVDPDRGERDNPHYCAITCAVRAAVPGLSDLSRSVVMTGARLHIDGRPYPVPKRVADWMCQWDRGEAVEAISFNLFDVHGKLFPQAQEG